MLNPYPRGSCGEPLLSSFSPLLLLCPMSALTKNTRKPLTPLCFHGRQRRKNNNKRPYSLETANEIDIYNNPILQMRTFTPAAFLHNADNYLWSSCLFGSLPSPLYRVLHEKETFVCWVPCCIRSVSKTIRRASESEKTAASVWFGI